MSGIECEGSEGRKTGRVTGTWSSGETDLQVWGCPLIMALVRVQSLGIGQAWTHVSKLLAQKGVCLRIKIASRYCVCAFMSVWLFVIIPFCFLFINCQPACQPGIWR